MHQCKILKSETPSSIVQSTLLKTGLWKFCCIFLILFGLSSCAYFPRGHSLPTPPEHFETQLIEGDEDAAAGLKGVLIQNKWSYQNKVAYTVWYNYSTKTWAVNPNAIPYNGRRFFTTGSKNFAVAIFYYKNNGAANYAKGCFVPGNKKTNYIVNSKQSISCSQ